MNFSIRKFLLFNLLTALFITTWLAAIGNYYLNLNDIENHLDEILIETAVSLEKLMHTDLQKKNYLATLSQRHKRAMSKDRFRLQVWDLHHHLLLSSDEQSSNFLEPLSKTGFHTQNFHHEQWRSFTLINNTAGFKILVATREDIRDELAHQMIFNYLEITLFVFPLSGLLIWFVISISFRTLDKIAKEVADREPEYLKPVDVKNIPPEIKPVIDEINQLLERIAQSLEREQRFAADAAHELRTPLAALKTHAQVASQTTDPQERQFALAHLLQGVDRSTHIVQQLLTLSRLTPGASHLEGLAKISLSKIVTDIMAQLAPTAIEKNIDIALHSPNHPIYIQGHFTALNILVRNLVDNAIRYTPENGKVDVELIETPDKVVLRVVDNGPGIPSELRSRVFERFYRVLGNKSPGSGLGLAIVQQIANLHGAAVKLSSPSQGTGLVIEVFFSKNAFPHP